MTLRYFLLFLPISLLRAMTDQSVTPEQWTGLEGTAGAVYAAGCDRITIYVPWRI